MNESLLSNKVQRAVSRRQPAAPSGEAELLPPRLGWLDVLDLEPTAEERVRLANDALVQPIITSLAMDRITLRRTFIWPRLQGGSKPVAALQTLSFIFFVLLAWLEFNGSWQLSWPLIVATLLALISLNAALGRVGERIARFGHSWVKLHPTGIRMRLFYGRRPTASQFLGGRIRRPAYIWPRRYSVPWDEIARVGLYTAAYGYGTNSSYRELHWVRLWAPNGTGYTLLVTSHRQEAEELTRLIVGYARLTAWAEINERGVNCLDGSASPLDERTIANWKIDRKRLYAPSGDTEASVTMWHADRLLLPSRQWRRWPRRLATAALTGTLLLTLWLNYDNLISQLIWTPPSIAVQDDTWLGSKHDAGNSNRSEQTLIPPLHEVWHAPAAERSDLSLAAGKLVACGGGSALVYAASSGKELARLPLRHGYSSDCTISADGGYLYYITSGQELNPDGSTGKEFHHWLTADNINTGAVAWQHEMGVSSYLLLVPEHHLIIAGITIDERTSNSAVAVEALDPQSGAVVWRTGALDQDGFAAMAVGGDVLYVAPSRQQLYTLDISSGRTLWHKSQSDAFKLMADAQRVYVSNIKGVTIYTRDGTELKTDANDRRDVESYIMGLRGGKVYTFDDSNDGRSLFKVDEQGWQRLASGGYLSHVSVDNAEMALSGELAFVRVKSENGLFGYDRLVALRLDNGQQIWHSPPFSTDENLITQPIIGSGMIYLVYNGEVHAWASAR